MGARLSGTLPYSISDGPAALRTKAIPLATGWRLAYVAGVPKRSRDATGRWLSDDELPSLGALSGDPPEP